MIELPPVFETVLNAELASLNVSRHRQIAALRELFELFTTERSQLGRQSYLDQPRLRSAYLGYHLPLNVARAAYVLTQVAERTDRLAQLRSVVDLGGGPGSAAWATVGQTMPSTTRGRESTGTVEGRRLKVERGPSTVNLQPSTPVPDSQFPRSHAEGPQSLKVTVFDQSSGALTLGEKLWRAGREHFPQVEMSFVKHNLPFLPKWEGPALVWLAMVLNELMRNRRFDLPRFVAGLTARCEPGSVLILTEPALRKPGRDLLMFHDLALPTGQWEVIAPCTHQLACPLLKLRDKSWCHFRFDWRVPQSVLDLAQPLKLECRTPSVAYLALLKIEEKERGSAPRTNEARVIGDPMPLKSGEKGIYVCREGQRELLSPIPSGAKRGDVIRLGPGRKRHDKSD